MSWLIYALLSATLFAAGALVSRVISVDSSYPRAYSVMFGFISSVLVLFLFLTQPITFHQLPLYVILLTFVATLCYGLGDRLSFFLSKHIEASLLTIIDKLTPVVTFVASLVFLGEALTAKKLIAVILIIVGNVIVVYKSTLIKINKAFFLALLVAVCVGIALTIDKRVSTSYPLPFYTLINFFMPAVYNISLPPLPVKALAYEFKHAFWRVALFSIITVTAYFCVLKALSLGEASKVVPVQSSSTIIIVLAGVFFLKERTHLRRKFIAGICVFIGVVLLGT